MLDRLEGDYEGAHPGLVGEALSCLWGAHRGLSEAELLDLLGEAATPLPQAIWSPLHRAIEGSLLERGGLIGFADEYLRRAVGTRYLPSKEAQLAVHHRLASHFEAQMAAQATSGETQKGRMEAFLKRAQAAARHTLTPPEVEMARRVLAPYTVGVRAVEELPWQLAEAGAWAQLYALLARPEFACSAWSQDRFALLSYWRQVETRGAGQMLDAYRPVLISPQQHTAHLADLANLLGTAGHPEESLALYEALAGHYRKIGDFLWLAFVLENMAATLVARGETVRAAPIVEEIRGIYRRLGTAPLTGVFRLSEGDVLRIQGKPREALRCYEAEERLARQKRDLGQVAAACWETRRQPTRPSGRPIRQSSCTCRRRRSAGRSTTCAACTSAWATGRKRTGPSVSWIWPGNCCKRRSRSARS